MRHLSLCVPTCHSNEEMPKFIGVQWVTIVLAGKSEMRGSTSFSPEIGDAQSHWGWGAQAVENISRFHHYLESLRTGCACGIRVSRLAQELTLVLVPQLSRNPGYDSQGQYPETKISPDFINHVVSHKNMLGQLWVWVLGKSSCIAGLYLVATVFSFMCCFGTGTLFLHHIFPFPLLIFCQRDTPSSCTTHWDPPLSSPPTLIVVTKRSSLQATYRCDFVFVLICFLIWGYLLKINFRKRSKNQWDQKTQSSQLSSSPDA